MIGLSGDKQMVVGNFSVDSWTRYWWTASYE